MLFLRFFLFVLSSVFVVAAVLLVAYDIFLIFQVGRWLKPKETPADKAGGELAGEASASPTSTTSTIGAPLPGSLPAQLRIERSRRAIRWAAAGQTCRGGSSLFALAAKSILVVPDGNAAVRISQISGVRPGTLYAGTHLITPLVERAQLYDVRDQVFSTSSAEGTREKLEVLNVETREGLEVGLAVTVRYRIDPRRLDYVQANLPQPIDQEIVAPVVTSVFREVAPNYVVRDIFAIKREEFRAARDANHYGAAEQRCHRGERSVATQSSATRGVRAGPARLAVEGTRGRPRVRGSEHREKESEDRGIAG